MTKGGKTWMNNQKSFSQYLVLSPVLWDTDVDTHQTPHGSAATEAFPNRWRVSVCCQVLGTHMHLWPLLTNWYWCQIPGWDATENHRMLPCKYMNYSNFTIDGYRYRPLEDAEEYWQPADGTVSPLFFMIWEWASCGAFCSAVTRALLRSMIISVSLFRSFLPPFFPYRDTKSGCLLLSCTPDKSQKTENIHFCYKCNHFIRVSTWIWSHPGRRGHLCAQVCAADSMNIYVLDMNMVI